MPITEGHSWSSGGSAVLLDISKHVSTQQPCFNMLQFSKKMLVSYRTIFCSTLYQQSAVWLVFMTHFKTIAVQ